MLNSRSQLERVERGTHTRKGPRLNSACSHEIIATVCTCAIGGWLPYQGLAIPERGWHTRSAAVLGRLPRAGCHTRVVAILGRLPY